MRSLTAGLKLEFSSYSSGLFTWLLEGGKGRMVSIGVHQTHGNTRKRIVLLNLAFQVLKTHSGVSFKVLCFFFKEKEH